MAPARSRKARQSRSGNSAPKHKEKPLKFGIPYFAHQQLDPERYSLSASLPVGKPGWAAAPKEIATATNGGWGDGIKTPGGKGLDAGADLDTTDSRSEKRNVPKSREKAAVKRPKVPGGRPAMAKKVTADLDSDDEIIVRMKHAKYLEKDIAQRLVDEGRVAYNTKTIGTRWARLKRALAKHNDELLDAQLVDWHEGDDDVLYESYRRADAIVTKMKQDAENRRWKLVADDMKNTKPVVDFSQNACRSRYQDLEAGIAKPTPESIANPDEETLRRIRSRREKEKKIEEYKLLYQKRPAQHENIRGNGWTSKTPKFV